MGIGRIQKIYSSGIENCPANLCGSIGGVVTDR